MKIAKSCIISSILIEFVGFLVFPQKWKWILEWMNKNLACGSGKLEARAINLVIIFFSLAVGQVFLSSWGEKGKKRINYPRSVLPSSDIWQPTAPKCMYIWTTSHAILHLKTFETITFVRRKYSSSVDWLVVTFPKHTDFAEKILFLPQNLEFLGHTSLAFT